MSGPLCYWRGELRPAAELAIAPWDSGFVQGVTVAEQLRTFGGRLFRLERHLERLRDSLRTIGMDAGIPLDELGQMAVEVAGHNHRLLAAGDDLGVSLFVTPGPYKAFVPADLRDTASGQPTIGIHTYPLAFSGFAGKYARGERLVVSTTRQVPSSCWPASLKCRSRMHYYLADQEARRRDPEARALLLDQDGWISEASTANFLIYNPGEGFVSPPRHKILPGVSVSALEELAAELRIPFVSRDLSLGDAYAASEACLSSTSPCLLPVVSIDGRPVGDGRPGPVFQRAIAAWSELVGMDIVSQAQRFATR